MALSKGIDGRETEYVSTSQNGEIIDRALFIKKIKFFLGEILKKDSFLNDPKSKDKKASDFFQNHDIRKDILAFSKRGTDFVIPSKDTRNDFKSKMTERDISDMMTVFLREAAKKINKKPENITVSELRQVLSEISGLPESDKKLFHDQHKAFQESLKELKEIRSNSE